MHNANLVNYLQTHTILSALQPGYLDRLVAHATEIRLQKDDLLFRQGEPAEQFYVMKAGKMMVGVPAINGPALEVQELGVDDVIGWSWLIAPYKWTFEAKAQEDTTLIAFDGKAILAECEADPAMGFALMKIFASLMSSRLHASRMRMMQSWAPAGWA